MPKWAWLLFAAVPIAGIGYLATQFETSDAAAERLSRETAVLRQQHDAVADRITLAEFSALRTGMSHAEVQEIVGSGGKLISESELAGVHTAMYQFEGEGSLGANASVMFQNGELIQKSQFGLR
ncbi:hypothetical protein [Pelagerythrobacter aerophilus]|nr:hypothetical protein [Pelagerythrobacter aerophilus]